MRIYIIIPAYNEEQFLSKTLDSLINQTLPPTKILVVDDNSTDGTSEIITQYAQNHKIVDFIKNESKGKHEPGSKVINAFNRGLSEIDSNYDAICKFDADLIFPKNYLQTITEHFSKNPRCGMAGGFCFIQKGEQLIRENLTNEDHLRGALKAYRKECFESIGGLRESMGWDTVDELLAKYHGWEVITDTTLKVIHLKATGASYTHTSKLKQGEAFRRMRYGFWLSVLGAAKLAFRKGNFTYFINCMEGYFRNGKKYIVTEEEGTFIRHYRWRNIKNKLF